MEGPTIDKKTTTGRVADRESPQCTAWCTLHRHCHTDTHYMQPLRVGSCVLLLARLSVSQTVRDRLVRLECRDFACSLLLVHASSSTYCNYNVQKVVRGPVPAVYPASPVSICVCYFLISSDK